MEKALKGDAQEQHEKYDLANMTSTCCTRVIIFFYIYGRSIFITGLKKNKVQTCIVRVFQGRRDE